MVWHTNCLGRTSALYISCKRAPIYGLASEDVLDIALEFSHLEYLGQEFTMLYSTGLTIAIHLLKFLIFAAEVWQYTVV